MAAHIHLVSLVASVLRLLVLASGATEEVLLNFPKRDPDQRLSGAGKSYPYQVLSEKVHKYDHPPIHVWDIELTPYITDDQLTIHYLGEQNARKNGVNMALWDWREEVRQGADS